MQRFIVWIHWPPEGRSRYGHGYHYLVFANSADQAEAITEARWEGKTGGDKPHTTEVLGATEVNLFELSRLPSGIM